MATAGDQGRARVPERLRRIGGTLLDGLRADHALFEVTALGGPNLADHHPSAILTGLAVTRSRVADESAAVQDTGECPFTPCFGRVVQLLVSVHGGDHYARPIAPGTANGDAVGPDEEGRPGALGRRGVRTADPHVVGRRRRGHRRRHGDPRIGERRRRVEPPELRADGRPDGRHPLDRGVGGVEGVEQELDPFPA